MVIAICIAIMIAFKKIRNVKIKKIPTQDAVLLAKEFVDMFNNKSSLEDLNKISEEVIEMAIFYFKRYDFASYNCLFDAAKETSFMYQGNKYAHELIEDIIRKCISVHLS